MIQVLTSEKDTKELTTMLENLVDNLETIESSSMFQTEFDDRMGENIVVPTDEVSSEFLHAVDVLASKYLINGENAVILVNRLQLQDSGYRVTAVDREDKMGGIRTEKGLVLFG